MNKLFSRRHSLVSWMGNEDANKNGSKTNSTDNDIDYVSKMHKQYVLGEISDDIAQRERWVHEIKKSKKNAENRKKITRIIGPKTQEAH